MLETIAVVLLILWLIGWLAIPTLGALVHILLVLAIITILVRIIRGKPPV